MRDEDDNWIRPPYKFTCKDFKHTGVDCCEVCHDPEWADLELRVVKVDGANALLCCCMVAFFYPRNPGKGMSPEEKLLIAIFGEQTVHDAAKKYIDPVVYDPNYDGDEFDD